MLHLPGSTNKALANYVLYLILFNSICALSVSYLCTLSFKLAALQASCIHSVTLTLCLVACFFVFYTLLECLASVELVTERGDHFFSWSA